MGGCTLDSFLCVSSGPLRCVLLLLAEYADFGNLCINLS